MSYLGLLPILLFSSVDHALYLSLIEAEQFPDRTAITVKVFTDDLQNAIRNFNDSYTFLHDSTFVDDNAESIEAYFRQHLSVGTDTLSFTASSLVGDSYWIEFRTSGTGASRIMLKADYFMELFPTQQNIIIFKRGEEKRSCRLVRGAEKCEVNFSD